MLRHGRVFLCLFVAFVAAVVLRNLPPAAIPDKLALPFRLLSLRSAPPDATLTMPVSGLAARRVADTWGAPRSGQRKHEGQDLFARRGTPVVSATRGVVVRKGNGGLGGISVSVFGPGGRVYYYAHLDGWTEGLEVGDTVEPGSVLGFVGNTGNARTTPPHLHFGVYTERGAIDPLPLLRS